MVTNIPGRSHHCSPGTPCPGAPQHHVQEPGTAEGTDITVSLGLPCTELLPQGSEGWPKVQWDVGGPVTTSPGLWGRAAAHQLCPAWLPRAALLHEAAQTSQPGHRKAKRETVGSCFVLIQHPARHLSQGSPVLTQSCPIPPPAKGCWHVHGPCPARAAPAEPAPGHLPGFEARQEFYPGFWLPFPSKGFALVPVS